MAHPSEEFIVPKGLPFSGLTNYRKDYYPREVRVLDKEKDLIVSNRRITREKYISIIFVCLNNDIIDNFL
jgi:hypothetical protein